MDHQIEHHADIGAAAGPRAFAHAFDGERRILIIEQAAFGEDETFLMADGQHQAARGGQRDQFLGLFQIGGDGLFHQHMRAGVQEARAR